MTIGDEISVTERSILLPNGFYNWKGKVTDIQSNYIEAEFYRTPEPFVIELCKKLANNHRTYLKQTMRIYLTPTP